MYMPIFPSIAFGSSIATIFAAIRKQIPIGENLKYINNNDIYVDKT